MVALRTYWQQSAIYKKKSRRRLAQTFWLQTHPYAFGSNIASLYLVMVTLTKLT